MSQPILLPQQAHQFLKQGTATAVDVREPGEYAVSHLEGAELAPLTTLEEATRRWDRERPLLLYCQSGRRSDRAYEVLKGLGFRQLLLLDGGITAWKKAGLPVWESGRKVWSLERQVRFAVGLFAALFTLLGLTVDGGFLYLNFLLSGGLIFSAVTDTCGLALVLTRLPWNR